MTGTYLSHYQDFLVDLEARNQLRAPRACPEGMVDFCGNDYLGWARRQSTQNAAHGAGASRLVSGTHSEHLRAEALLSQQLGHERSLLFASAYAANVGILQALSSIAPEVEFYSDALNHASIVDGCRLAKANGARVQVFAHLDWDALATILSRARNRQKPAFLLLESLYSMDGDVPDFARARALADAFDVALIVDHTHALAIESWLAIDISGADIVVTGFGKALGLWGGAVSATREMISFFENRARSYVFSTATPPVHAVWLAERLVAQSTDSAARLDALAKNQTQLAALLREHRLNIAPNTHARSPILPVVFGSESAALAASMKLAEGNIFVPAIRPPTVPTGSSRLRFTATSAHKEADFALLNAALKRL